MKYIWPVRRPVALSVGLVADLRSVSQIQPHLNPEVCNLAEKGRRSRGRAEVATEHFSTLHFASDPAPDVEESTVRESTEMALPIIVTKFDTK